VPPGFHPAHIAATRSALLRKRAGEVAHRWPAVAASYGRSGASPSATGGHPAAAWVHSRRLGFRPHQPPDRCRALELAVREVLWRYDGVTEPRRRMMPRCGACDGGWSSDVRAGSYDAHMDLGLNGRVFVLTGASAGSASPPPNAWLPTAPRWSSRRVTALADRGAAAVDGVAWSPICPMWTLRKGLWTRHFRVMGASTGR